MKRFILIILTIILLSMVTIGLNAEVRSQERPYVKNEILYIRNKKISIQYITRMKLIIGDYYKYAIIEYWYNKTDGGIMTISYNEFVKLQKYFDNNKNYNRNYLKL